MRPAPKPDNRRKIAIVAGAVIVLLALAVLLKPSPYGKVTNLASSGATVIAFGDSLTAGYGVPEPENYPSRLAALTGLTIENAGVSGDTTATAMARLDRDVLSKDPRVVIVGLGGNDFLRGVPIATTEENLRTIVRQIQGAGAMAVLLGFAFPSLTADYAGMYERVAEEEGCLLVPRVLKGILTKDELKVDAIHPNSKGYEIMTGRVADPLEKLLRKADAAR
jgi:acyl-CoA thioesterase I